MTARGMRLAAATIMLAVACAGAPAGIGPEVDAYLRRADGWAPVEAETAQTIERILRTQFVDEAEVRRQIADNRPRILAHLEHIRGYTPRTPAIARIHARYREAWERLLAGYEAIEQGFTNGDYTQLARGREAMGAWRDGLVDTAAELRELRQRAGPDASGATESRAAPAPQLSTHNT